MKKIYDKFGNVVGYEDDTYEDIDRQMRQLDRVRAEQERREAKENAKREKVYSSGGDTPWWISIPAIILVIGYPVYLWHTPPLDYSTTDIGFILELFRWIGDIIGRTWNYWLFGFGVLLGICAIALVIWCIVKVVEFIVEIIRSRR